MTAFDATQWVGSKTVRITDAQVAQMDRYDSGLGAIGVSALWRSAGMFMLPFTLAAAVNNATVVGLAQVARIPFKLVHLDVGCESAAGSTATLDLHKAVAATPTSFATMLEAAVDVQTAAGTMQAASVTDTKEDIAVGDHLRIVGIGGGSGAVVGSSGLAICYRL